MNFKKPIFVLFLLVQLFICGCVAQEYVIPQNLPSEELEKGPLSEEESYDQVVNGTDAINQSNLGVVNVDVLRFRSGPGTDYEILERLYYGKILEILDENNGWLMVKPYGEIGWVHGDYVARPRDGQSLYETLDVDVQPVGYSKVEVSAFIEKATSFSLIGFVLPEFNNPNELRNDELILALTLSGMTPTYYGSGGPIITGKDIEQTARAIFGGEIKKVQHGYVFPYIWNNDKGYYVIEGFGPAYYTSTKVISVIESEEKFIVDAVHLIHNYDPYSDEPEDIYDEFMNLIVSLPYGASIEKYIQLFPTRRYILSKEGNGISYIKQSFLLGS